jgi:hypothetical protein
VILVTVSGDGDTRLFVEVNKGSEHSLNPNVFSDECPLLTVSAGTVHFYIPFFTAIY